MRDSECMIVCSIACFMLAVFYCFTNAALCACGINVPVDLVTLTPVFALCGVGSVTGVLAILSA